jgi:tripartite ATP-independent transporter DctM subunit
VHDLMPFCLFILLGILMALGLPVAFALGGSALFFVPFVSHPGDLLFVSYKVFALMGQESLMTIPLFVLMGLVLEKTGISERLLLTLAALAPGYRGGLLTSVILVGAVLAASTGIVGATVVTMGLVSLPALLEKKCDPSLACGVIAASGTLGQIIPPSLVLVLLGDLLGVNVSDLFLGAMVPGGLLVLGYVIYVNGLGFFKPQLLPLPSVPVEPLSFKKILGALLGPVILIFTVLGSILFGIATPTEGASCGVFGAMTLGWMSQRLSPKALESCLLGTVQITGMIFLIIVAAQFFSSVFRMLEGDRVLVQLVSGHKLDPSMVLFFMLGLIFVLGFFLDFIEISYIVIPIFLPMIAAMGLDRLWLGVLMGVNLQTSFLTPPFGFSLFYLKGVAPPGITTRDIYRGVVPFIVIQLIVMGLCLAFPGLVTYLPRSFRRF